MQKFLFLSIMLFGLFITNIAQTFAQDSTRTRTDRDRNNNQRWGRNKDDNTNYFDNYFQPGAGYSFYAPKASDSLGRFSGVVIEYLIWAGVRQNEDRGPSHTRLYTKINILKSDKNNVSDMFMYGAGLNFSFERNPKRSYLIPYFGIELGGISQRNIGSTFQMTPLLGVHLLARRNIFVNLHGGYVYPINDFERLQGYFGQLGINFALW